MNSIEEGIRAQKQAHVGFGADVGRLGQLQRRLDQAITEEDGGFQRSTQRQALFLGVHGILPADATRFFQKGQANVFLRLAGKILEGQAHKLLTEQAVTSAGFFIIESQPAIFVAAHRLLARMGQRLGGPQPGKLIDVSQGAALAGKAGQVAGGKSAVAAGGHSGGDVAAIGPSPQRGRMDGWLTGPPR